MDKALTTIFNATRTMLDEEFGNHGTRCALLGLQRAVAKQPHESTSRFIEVASRFLKGEALRPVMKQTTAAHAAAVGCILVALDQTGVIISLDGRDADLLTAVGRRTLDFLTDDAARAEHFENRRDAGDYTDLFVTAMSRREQGMPLADDTLDELLEYAVPYVAICTTSALLVQGTPPDKADTEQICEAFDDFVDELVPGMQTILGSPEM
ncbi:MAG: hypothetical protein U5L04_01505 [Trueperaceae bacterium]|nr:hypothetical protein [Trueperaceae bacterium]